MTSDLDIFRTADVLFREPGNRDCTHHNDYYSAWGSADFAPGLHTGKAAHQAALEAPSRLDISTRQHMSAAAMTKSSCSPTPPKAEYPRAVMRLWKA